MLHAARWKYRTQKWRKNRHLSTTAQLCWAESSQLRHVSTISNRQQYLPHISSQYGELRPTSGWDLLASLGHSSKFQRVSRLGSVTARHSSSGRQPNCGAEHRTPPIFGRAAITLGIGPDSSFEYVLIVNNVVGIYLFSMAGKTNLQTYFKPSHRRVSLWLDILSPSCCCCCYFCCYRQTCRTYTLRSSMLTVIKTSSKWEMRSPSTTLHGYRIRRRYNLLILLSFIFRPAALCRWAQ